MGMWKTNAGGRMVSSAQLYYFLSFFVFAISAILETLEKFTDKIDESIFLVVTSLISVVQIGRLYNIIWKQNKILGLISAASDSSTNDYATFCKENDKLDKLMLQATCFILITFLAVVVVACLPFIRKELTFDIAFPLDYRNIKIAFYAAYAFVVNAFFVSVASLLFATMLWFIMLNFVGKYEILGNDFKNLGVVTTEEEGQKNAQTLYFQHLVESIKSLEHINGYTKTEAIIFRRFY